MQQGLFLFLFFLIATWGVVAIIRAIVDGVVATKKARMEVEREYLAQMLSDLEEIKARLDEQESRETVR